jgi:alpha-L-rhamnosidase
VTIDPQVPAGLAYVSASIDTVRGRVSSHWTRTSAGLSLTVTVPAGVTATVHVPLLGSHQTARAVTGGVRAGGRTAAWTVGSGTWQFRSS